MEILRLWEDHIPGEVMEDGAPALRYFPAEERITDAAVLIFAGGGYTHRSVHEGEGYAELLNSWGMDAFVLDYRVNPVLFPFPLLDARRAIRVIRSAATRLGLDKNKIAVMGSSAGGHLAALLSTYRDMILGEGRDSIDNEDAIPNMQILAYPVLDIDGHRSSFEMLMGDNVDKHEELTPRLLATEVTPPAFIWHTSTDDVVDVNNTFRYAPQYNIRIANSVLSLLSSMSRIITDKVRDWYSAKHKTVDKKLLEEMSELDRRVVIDTPTDNDEDEGNSQGMIL